MMKTIIKQADGLTLVGKADSNHWVVMDSSIANGGHGAGATPMELMLMALGSCTSMDIISILQKKRVKWDRYECALEAERAEEHPRVFTRIKIKVIFYGQNISPEAVARAIELSETKYCSVSAMLRQTAQIDVDFEIFAQ